MSLSGRKSHRDQRFVARHHDVDMETVRGSLRASRLAEVAEFYFFGTNDLTQTVYSFSREDAEKKFLTIYIGERILKDNPLEVIDMKGVGKLIQLAIEWSRKTNPDIEIGICGEHGWEPRSIAFFNVVGVKYVSCSHFRLTVARLVASKAALENIDLEHIQAKRKSRLKFG